MIFLYTARVMGGYDKLYKDMEAGKIISAYAVEGHGAAEAVSKRHLAINLCQN